MNLRDLFKSAHHKYLEKNCDRLVEENIRLRELLAAALAKVPEGTSHQVEIGGAYPKCDGCGLIVARFDRTPEGKVICANCSAPRTPSPAARQTSRK